MIINENDHIQKICALLDSNYVEYLDGEPRKKEQEYLSSIPKLKDSLGDASHYFFGNSHDSKIQKAVYHENDMTIYLNDISTCEFADAFNRISENSGKRTKFNFPVKIIFKNIKHLSINSVSSRGKIHRRDLKYLDFITEYLQEEFVKIDQGKNEIAIIVAAKIRNMYTEFLLLIACGEIQIYDELLENWIFYFGSEKNEIFTDYMKKRKEGEYFADFTVCQKYLTMTYPKLNQSL